MGTEGLTSGVKLLMPQDSGDQFGYRPRGISLTLFRQTFERAHHDRRLRQSRFARVVVVGGSKPTICSTDAPNTLAAVMEARPMGETLLTPEGAHARVSVLLLGRHQTSRRR